MDINEQILENERLVFFTINKYYNSLLQDEDIEQMGRIGLWKAIETYDESKGNFSTYAVSCIKNEISREVMIRGRKKRKIEEAKLCHIDDEKNFVQLAEGRNMEEEVHDRMVLEELLKEFDNEERQIIELKSKGYRNKIIAERLGLKEYQISRMVDKYRQRTKRKYKGCIEDVL